MLDKILKNNNSNIHGIIQVGANIGQEIPILTKYTNNIYLFEPLTKAFEELRKNISNYKDINIFKYALGEKDEIKKINISNTNYSASSSFLKPSLHLEYFPEIEFDSYEEVQIKRFDNINSKFYANFLILDVQGYELNVIKGFADKINNIDFIYTEISIEELYENSVLIKELDEELYELGFIRTKTKIASNKPQGDALYRNAEFFSNNKKSYYKIKSNFQLTKIYLFLNFIKDYRKIIYLIKKSIKNK
tara:strand:+ start:613 stop:1356 length:744 start_codon:yes stop_codon:yes gene_type:complete